MLAPSNDDVTVVITCFNYGEFLPAAVSSVQSQKDGSPRIIVVDDGSTDADTVRTLDLLADQVDVVRQTNQGLSAARNFGIERSSTPLFITLDADDLLANDALRSLRVALLEDPSAGFSYGLTRFIGDWTGPLRMPDYDPYRLLYRHTIGSTCLTRRELFDDVGGFDVSFPGFEDWEFWLHSLARGWRGTRTDVVTLLYRKHGNTMLSGARRDYGSLYLSIKNKHDELYARRADFARESDLGVLGRIAYRFYWGPRPIPAALEQRAYEVLFKRR